MLDEFKAEDGDHNALAELLIDFDLFDQYMSKIVSMFPSQDHLRKSIESLVELFSTDYQ